MITVIGVDGCPAGWVAVVWTETVSHHVFSDFSDILALNAAIIAVDMPMGLPEFSGRSAEREARKGLGARQSSLFVIPSRAAVMCDGYRDACNTNLKHSDPPRRVAKQTYHLFPKIREIDAVLTPDLQLRVHEVHPEVSFWMMNGRTPVPVAKKVGSRNHRPGLDFRRTLLGSNGFPIAKLRGNHYRQSDVGEDDLIDACACAWSARRILDGQYVSFPETPERDSRSLTMCIKA